MFRFAALLAPLLVSNIALAGGVAVGHPVEFSGGTGIALASGYLPVSSLVFDRCDGTYTTTAVNANVDAVNGGEIMVPDGLTCGIRINLSGPAHLEGSGNGGTFTADITATYIHVEVETPIHVVDGTSNASLVQLASPDWITATNLGLSSGTHVVIDSSSTIHPTLRDRLRASSAY
jgi:hypothetical protein